MEDLKNNITQVELLVKSLRFRRTQLRRIKKLDSKKKLTTKEWNELHKLYDISRRGNCPLCKYIMKTYKSERCGKCIAGQSITDVCYTYMDRSRYPRNRYYCLQWLTKQINRWNNNLKCLKDKKPIKLNTPFAKTMRTW